MIKDFITIELPILLFNNYVEKIDTDISFTRTDAILVSTEEILTCQGTVYSKCLTYKWSYEDSHTEITVKFNGKSNDKIKSLLFALINLFYKKNRPFKVNRDTLQHIIPTNILQVSYSEVCDQLDIELNTSNYDELSEIIDDLQRISYELQATKKDNHTCEQLTKFKTIIDSYDSFNLRNLVTGEEFNHQIRIQWSKDMIKLMENGYMNKNIKPD